MMFSNECYRALKNEETKLEIDDDGIEAVITPSPPSPPPPPSPKRVVDQCSWEAATAEPVGTSPATTTTWSTTTATRRRKLLACIACLVLLGLIAIIPLAIKVANENDSSGGGEATAFVSEEQQEDQQQPIINSNNNAPTTTNNNNPSSPTTTTNLNFNPTNDSPFSGTAANGNNNNFLPTNPTADAAPSPSFGVPVNNNNNNNNFLALNVFPTPYPTPSRIPTTIESPTIIRSPTKNPMINVDRQDEEEEAEVETEVEPGTPGTPMLGTIEYVGGNGKPPEAFPLGACKGDCDDDDECAEGLICLERDSPNDPVSLYCDGEPDPDIAIDYCIPITNRPSDDQQEEEEVDTEEESTTPSSSLAPTSNGPSTDVDNSLLMDEILEEIEQEEDITPIPTTTTTPSTSPTSLLFGGKFPDTIVTPSTSPTSLLFGGKFPDTIVASAVQAPPSSQQQQEEGGAESPSQSQSQPQPQQLPSLRPTQTQQQQGTPLPTTDRPTPGPVFSIMVVSVPLWNSPSTSPSSSPSATPTTLSPTTDIPTPFPTTPQPTNLPTPVPTTAKPTPDPTIEPTIRPSIMTPPPTTREPSAFPTTTTPQPEAEAAVTESTTTTTSAPTKDPWTIWGPGRPTTETPIVTPPPSKEPTFEPTTVEPTLESTLEDDDEEEDDDDDEPDDKQKNNKDKDEDDDEEEDDEFEEEEELGIPTGLPTKKPTFSPTIRPGNPTRKPTNRPTPPTDEMSFVPGLLTEEEHGLILSKGLSARIIAETGRNVQYDKLTTAGNGMTESEEVFHTEPDAGATFVDPSPDNVGGWIYISNSEVEDNEGGVGAITFDSEGRVIKYQMLLTNTDYNCGGGKTPWDTWISCEESGDSGVIWQVDPTGERSPEQLTLGSDGGSWESFAYDIRDLDQPHFFVTEDEDDGALQRFTPVNFTWSSKDTMWDMLHGPGVTEYLILEPSETTPTGTFSWGTNKEEAKENAEWLYPHTEGVDIHDGMMYFVCKEIHVLFSLDLDAMTYTWHSTESGIFDGEPDQLKRILSTGGAEFLYFTEDGGDNAGVHGRDETGLFFTLLESEEYEDETTGLAFSPDYLHMYIAYQENGLLFDVTRNDGHPFSAKSLDVKYHVANEVNLNHRRWRSSKNGN